MNKFVHFFSLFFIWWFSLMLVPASYWYVPGEVTVANSLDGTSPKIEFYRHIKGDVRMAYQVVIRGVEGTVVCEATSSPFTYKENKGTINKDLDWWVSGRCNPLRAGSYTMETCWTVTEPFAINVGSFRTGSYIPDKTVCRKSQFTMLVDEPGS